MKSLRLLTLALAAALLVTPPIVSHALEDMDEVENDMSDAEDSGETGLSNAAEKMEANAEKNEGKGNASEALTRNAERKKAKLESRQIKEKAKADKREAKRKAKAQRKSGKS